MQLDGSIYPILILQHGIQGYYYRPKLIKIIKGKFSEDFIQDHNKWTEEEVQMKLAKIKGHYKHGNER